MGYRKAPTIYELSFADPEYEGLEVRLRGVKVGKMRQIFALMNQDGLSDEQLDELFGLVEDNLVSWNLEDEDGNPVPCTKEGLNDQELPFVLDIVDTWIDGMTSVSDDLGKDSDSGETFPVALPQMEDL